VTRREAERAERAGEAHERTDWRGVAQEDLDDSDGELCFEDPRQAAWARLPQDLREVPEDEAVVALRSLVRAGAKATAGELATAMTSGAGLAKTRRASPRSSTREEECRFGCDCLGCCGGMAAFCLRLF
jgi:hypothetical protein